MNLIISILLIFVHSISNGEANLVETVKTEIEDYIEKGLTNFTGLPGLFSHKHNLELLKGEILGQTNSSLVWKGVYNDTVDVAVKIALIEACFDSEVHILKALNALNNPKIEEHGIPRVYYHGKFLHVYHAIVMTLFTETLKDVHNRCKLRGEPLSELSVLLIFKETIESLKYLNTKKIVHNDIKPENLFRRGATFFIGDFDSASFEDEQHRSFTPRFASSNFFAKKPRHQIDDLESLVFSIWYIAGVQGNGGPKPVPEGFALSICKKNGTAVAKMREKCKHFRNENVRKVFELVAADEMLMNKKVPDFERITIAINNAIYTFFKNSNWMIKSSTNFSTYFSREKLIH